MSEVGRTGEFYAKLDEIRVVSPDREHRARRVITPQMIFKIRSSIDNRSNATFDGQLAPIVVRHAKQVTGTRNYKYDLVDGECRYLAIKDLGRTEIRCILLEDCDDIKAREIEIIDSLARHDLVWQDYVQAYAELFEIRRQEHEQMHPLTVSALNRYSQTDFAAEEGLSESTVSNYLKLYNAREKYPGLIEESRTMSGALRELRRLEAELPKVEGSYTRSLREQYLVGTWGEALGQVEQCSAGLMILDMCDELLPAELYSRFLHNEGHLLVFTRVELLMKLQEDLRTHFSYVDDTIRYLITRGHTVPVHHFLWASPAIPVPPAKLEPTYSYRYEAPPQHPSTKPYEFWYQLLRLPDNGHPLVLAPQCYSVALVRACIDQKRPNVVYCPERDVVEKSILNTELEA